MRNEVGALGFVRQSNLQRDRQSFRGVGGRPQGLSHAPNPNHAPQRVAPRPWSVPERPPADATAAPRSIGSFLQEQRAEPAVTTIASLAGLALQPEDLRDDLASCKGRLDAAGLRISGQDNAIKTLERSVSALRDEYTKIVQATDGQSVARLDACERAVTRLDGAFQQFSSQLQRDLRTAEQAFAARDEPLACRALQAAPGLNPLELLHVHMPLHLDADGDVCLHRRSFDPATAAVTSSSFKVQDRAGEPLVAFI